jgi:hypothetical protein
LTEDAPEAPLSLIERIGALFAKNSFTNRVNRMPEAVRMEVRQLFTDLKDEVEHSRAEILARMKIRAGDESEIERLEGVCAASKDVVTTQRDLLATKTQLIEELRVSLTQHKAKIDELAGALLTADEKITYLSRAVVSMYIEMTHKIPTFKGSTYEALIFEMYGSEASLKALVSETYRTPRPFEPRPIASSEGAGGAGGAGALTLVRPSSPTPISRAQARVVYECCSDRGGERSSMCGCSCCNIRAQGPSAPFPVCKDCIEQDEKDAADKDGLLTWCARCDTMTGPTAAACECVKSEEAAAQAKIDAGLWCVRTRRPVAECQCNDCILPTFRKAVPHAPCTDCEPPPSQGGFITALDLLEGAADGGLPTAAEFAAGGGGKSAFKKTKKKVTIRSSLTDQMNSLLVHQGDSPHGLSSPDGPPPVIVSPPVFFAQHSPVRAASHPAVPDAPSKKTRKRTTRSAIADAAEVVPKRLRFDDLGASQDVRTRVYRFCLDFGYNGGTTGDLPAALVREFGLQLGIDIDAASDFARAYEESSPEVFLTYGCACHQAEKPHDPKCNGDGGYGH